MNELVGVGSQKITRMDEGSVSQVNGNSYLVPTCACRPCERRAQQKQNGACRHPLEKANPPSLNLEPENSVFLYVTVSFQAAIPLLKLTVSACE